MTGVRRRASHLFTLFNPLGVLRGRSQLLSAAGRHEVRIQKGRMLAFC